MSIRILKNSATELVITQRKKLTITGSMFCLPASYLLFMLPHAQGLSVLLGAIFLWMIVWLCFSKGVTYTFKANREEKSMQFSIHGFFRRRNRSFSYTEIDHILMAESASFFKPTAGYRYHILIETEKNKRFRFFGFSDRSLCKETRALMESYI